MSTIDAQPQGCTNFKLRQLLRRIARVYDAELVKVGLKGTQFSLLSQVMAHGPVRPNDLARILGIDASTMTRNLRPVAHAGWVALRPGPDERSRLVEITAAGRAKQIEAKRRWAAAQQEINAILGAPEVARMHAMIDRGLARLDGHVGAV